MEIYSVHFLANYYLSHAFMRCILEFWVCAVECGIENFKDLLPSLLNVVTSSKGT